MVYLGTTMVPDAQFAEHCPKAELYPVCETMVLETMNKLLFRIGAFTIALKNPRPDDSGMGVCFREREPKKAKRPLAKMDKFNPHVKKRKAATGVVFS